MNYKKIILKSVVIIIRLLMDIKRKQTGCNYEFDKERRLITQIENSTEFE